MKALGILLGVSLELVGCAQTGAALGCLGPHHSSLDACYDQSLREDRSRAESLEGERSKCDGGDQSACFRYGLLQEKGVPLSDAARTYEASCAHDYGPSCARLAQLLASSDLGRPDPPRALALGQKGCDRGAAAGCAVAAALHPDARAATALAERGCELGREACARAGRAYLTTDRARAERYFRRGCENNSDDACIALGRLDADVP